MSLNKNTNNQKNHKKKKIRKGPIGDLLIFSQMLYHWDTDPMW